MTAKAPTTKESEYPIPRDHSPCYEAIGPIVHNGFVAARIRDFQALQHDRSQMSSHSPMIHCPVPPWLQIYDPASTPKPIRTSDSYMSAVKKRSVPSLKQMFDARHEDPDTESYPSSTWRYRYGEMIRLHEKDICCPRAIPPSLALPFDEPPKCHSEIDVDQNESDHSRTIRPRRSIAERLGLMVDGDWEGYGSLNGGGIGMSQLLQSWPTPENINDWGGDYDDIISDGQISHLPLLSPGSEDGSETHPGTLQGFPERARYFDGEAKSSVRDFQLEEEQSPHEKESPPGTQHGHDYEESIAPVGAGAGPEEEEDHLAVDSSARHRAKTLDYPTRSATLANKRLRTRTISLSQLIDRHLTDWTALGKLQGRQRNTSGIAARAHVIEPNPPQSAPETITPDANQSSTTMQGSRQPSSTRSASWFSKFPRLRIALVDKTPSAKTPLLPRTASEVSIESTEVQKKLGSRSSILDNEHGEEEQEEERPVSDWQDQAGQQHPVANSQTQTQTGTMRVGHRRFPEPVADIFAKSLEAGHSSSSEEKIHCGGPVYMCEGEAPNLPFQLREGHSLKALNAHPSENLREPAMEESGQGQLHGVFRRAQVAELACDKQGPMIPKESDAIEACGSGWRPVSSLHASTTTSSRSLRSQFHMPESESEEQKEGGVTESCRAVQWEAVDGERGIRKVQIIVSMDGSEDFLIEAKVYRQSKSK